MREASALSPDQSTEELRTQWRHQFGPAYYESNARSFGVHIDNSLLAKLHIVQGALLAVDVFGDSKVSDIDVLYYSSNAKAPAGVMIHVPRTDPSRCSIRSQQTASGSPWRAFVNLPYQNKARTLGNLRLSCLTSIKGCERPELLLPILASLESLCAESTSMHQ